MTKKKICCITTIDATLIAFVSDAMYQFVEQGYEVTLVCADTTRVQKLKGNTFHYVDMPMKRGISLLDMFVMPLKFYCFFKHEKFDFVQSDNSGVLFRQTKIRITGIIPVIRIFRFNIQFYRYFFTSAIS